MKITRKSHRQIRIQNLLFYILFVLVVGGLGYLSTQYKFESDWTYGNRNSLSDATQELLSKLDKPIKLVVYIPQDSPIKVGLKELFAKYQLVKKDIELEFVDPNLQPKRVQEDGVQYAGQIAVHYGDRHELIESTSEQTLVETLQRLGEEGERFVVFLEGHGELDPFAGESTGMGKLVEVLQRKGIQVQPHNLVRSQSLPENTSFLVIAAPKKALLEGEVKVLKEYIEKGGNLLWLHEAGELQGLEPLEAELGINILNGTIVDANQDLQYLLGVDNPAVVPVIDYGRSLLAKGLSGTPSLYPFATGIEADDSEQAELWQFDPFLQSLPTSWLETGDLDGEVSFNPDQDDQPGPVVIGAALTRMIETEGSDSNKEQRVVVIGDSDFMQNAFLGYGANIDVASNIFNWLNQRDDFIQVAIPTAPDTRLELSGVSALLISLVFLIILPLGLLLAGFWVWWKRRGG